MRNASTELIGKESVEQFVIPKDLVRHIVVSIDNLPEQKVAERLRPVKPVPGNFAVGGSEESPVLDPANYERYKPLVQLIRSTDTQLLIATYTRYYPLFQQAYKDLGHPPQYFNDRLIEVIDHLLDDSRPSGADRARAAERAVRICRSKARVAFRGPEGADSHGQENARAVKDKLRELRTALVAKPPGN